jgi:hypothetical protein
VRLNTGLLLLLLLDPLVLHTGERAWRVCSGATVRALLLLLLLGCLARLCNRGLLEEQEGLDGIPLGLGHGLQAHERLGTGRNRHWGLYSYGRASPV